MTTPQEVMKQRFLKERKEEVEKDLKRDKKYAVSVSTQFVGRFSGFEELGGETYVIFVQEGVTDRGGIPYRKIKLKNLVDYSLIKT